MNVKVFQSFPMFQKEPVSRVNEENHCFSTSNQSAVLDSWKGHYEPSLSVTSGETVWALTWRRSCGPEGLMLHRDTSGKNNELKGSCRSWMLIYPQRGGGNTNNTTFTGSICHIMMQFRCLLVWFQSFYTGCWCVAVWAASGQRSGSHTAVSCGASCQSGK